LHTLPAFVTQRSCTPYESVTQQVGLTGDYNGDGMSDLLWRDNLGNTVIWFINGVTVATTGSLGNIPTVWTVQATNAE
jgi:hypothetical protein